MRELQNSGGKDACLSPVVEMGDSFSPGHIRTLKKNCKRPRGKLRGWGENFYYAIGSMYGVERGLKALPFKGSPIACFERFQEIVNLLLPLFFPSEAALVVLHGWQRGDFFVMAKPKSAAAPFVKRNNGKITPSSFMCTDTVLNDMEDKWPPLRKTFGCWTNSVDMKISLETYCSVLMATECLFAFLAFGPAKQA